MIHTQIVHVKMNCGAIRWMIDDPIIQPRHGARLVDSHAAMARDRARVLLTVDAEIDIRFQETAAAWSGRFQSFPGTAHDTIAKSA